MTDQYNDWLTELYQDIQAMRYHGACQDYFPDDEAKAMFIKVATDKILERAEEYYPKLKIAPPYTLPPDFVGISPMAPPTSYVFALREKYTNDNKTNPGNNN